MEKITAERCKAAIVPGGRSLEVIDLITTAERCEVGKINKCFFEFAKVRAEKRASACDVRAHNARVREIVQNACAKSLMDGD